MSMYVIYLTPEDSLNSKCINLAYIENFTILY